MSIEPTTNHSNASQAIPIADIIIADRMREDTPDVRKYIDDELVPSIAEHGLINPVVLDDENRLVAGWCRTQSFIALGHTTIPFVRRSSLSDADAKILEIEENLRRKDMRWQDYITGIADAHKLKTTESISAGEAWGQRQTGKLLGVPLGHVNQCTIVAKLLAANDEEISKAPNLDAALKILKTRKADEAIAELAKRAGVVTASPVEAPTKRKHGELPTASNPQPLDHSSDPLLGSEPEQQQGEVELTQLDIPLSKMLFNVDCVGWMHENKECADMILTDIPYGIDMANLEEVQGIEVVKDSHDVDENIELMPKFIDAAWEALKPDSYMVFWYDLKHHEKLRDWCEQRGFGVQPFPLVWAKTHPCRNQASHCHWTKAIETAMVCRKGKASFRNNDYRACYMMADGLAEKRMQKNPFSKPAELTNWILEPITIVGQTVLDPFAGGGSILRAAARRGLKILGCEKDEAQFPRLQESMREVYREMTRNRANFS